MADIEDIGKGPRKRSRGQSKAKAEETNAPSNDETAGGNSWRDFISNASAALEGLVEDTVAAVAEAATHSAAAPEAPTDQQQAAEAPEATETKKPSRKGKSSKKSKVDEIEWNTETKDLEMAESAPNGNQETVDRFEELARRVAESAADLRGTFDEPAMTEPSSETLDSMGDDSGEAPAALDQSAMGDDAETSFDIEDGTSQDELVAKAEGDVVPDESESFEADAAQATAIDFEMTPETTFEEGSEQLALGGSETSESELDSALNAEAQDVGDDFADETAEETADETSEEPAEFVTTETLMSVIESLLFSTDKPVSTSTMKQIFKGSNIRTKDIQLAIENLMSEFASPTRGVTLEEVNGGYQLRTKVDNAEYLRRLAKVRPFRLSGPALEVMAIVAYKQPITKHEIDEIRGVESGHLLRALMERGLVSFGGKSDLPGKPMTYNSTRKFLETFGLRNLKELPTLSEIDEILPEGIGEVEEKETLSDLTDSLSTSIGSTYSEGEDELEKINQQLQQVDTTSEFFEQEKIRERERRDRERAQDIREKLVLGDSVDEKDRRWLDRYEAKLASGTMAAENASAVDETVHINHNPEANTPLEPALQDEPGDLTEKLESLTAESTPMAAADEADDVDAEDASWMSENDNGEDLIGNEDWDEDDASSDGSTH